MPVGVNAYICVYVYIYEDIALHVYRCVSEYV